jgi:hypothetical protein
VFEPEDLLEMKDIPKVTRCLQDLAKLVRYNQVITNLFTP